MTPLELVLSRVRNPKRQGGGWVASCPAHDDRSPSLSIHEGEDGRVLVHCHAGCTTEAITAKLGMTLADLMPPRAGPPPKKKAPAGGPRRQTRSSSVYPTVNEAVAALEHRHGARTMLWTYHNADGEPVGVVVRWNTPKGKDIRPVSKSPTGWIIGAMPTPRPLYRLPELSARPGEPVYVAEGERCTDVLAELGLLATTSAGGAKAAGKTDWTPLAGREVVVLPDHDEAGAKYAGDVAGILAKLSPPARVRVVRLAGAWPDLPEGGDVADVATRGEVADSIRAKLAGLVKATPPAAEPVDPSGGLVVRCLADVQEEPITWLWLNRFAVGKLNLIGGVPGVGKSFLSLYLAAMTSRGCPWPDGHGNAPQGDVLIANAEDGAADTIKPRLRAMGSDLSRIHVVDCVKLRGADGKAIERGFNLADIVLLEAEIRRLPKLKLIVIDPVSAFLARADEYRNGEVRALLKPLARLAERYGVAIVLVTHLTKSGGTNSVHRMIGSIAFAGAARSVWLIIKDPKDSARRLMLLSKCNLATDQAGLAYSIVNGTVAWESAPISMGADEGLEMEMGATEHRSRPGPEPKERASASEWLREVLRAGPMESSKVKDEGKVAGYAWRTLHRAKDDLGVRPYREQFGGPWMWKLPPDPTCQDLSCHAPQNAHNLASWHDSRNSNKTEAFDVPHSLPCQDKQLATMGDDGGEWGEL